MTQLRTSVVIQGRCCCPDPAVCHCPDHDPDAPATIQACGRNGHVAVAPTLPMFEPPPEPAPAAIAAVVAPSLPLAPPHAPPDPRRPAAPS